MWMWKSPFGSTSAYVCHFRRANHCTMRMRRSIGSKAVFLTFLRASIINCESSNHVVKISKYNAVLQECDGSSPPDEVLYQIPGVDTINLFQLSNEATVPYRIDCDTNTLYASFTESWPLDGSCWKGNTSPIIDGLDSDQALKVECMEAEDFFHFRQFGTSCEDTNTDITSPFYSFNLINQVGECLEDLLVAGIGGSFRVTCNSNSNIDNTGDLDGTISQWTDDNSCTGPPDRVLTIRSDECTTNGAQFAVLACGGLLPTATTAEDDNMYSSPSPSTTPVNPSTGNGRFFVTTLSIVLIFITSGFLCA